MSDGEGEGNVVHTARIRCKGFYVDDYTNPSFCVFSTSKWGFLEEDVSNSSDGIRVIRICGEGCHGLSARNGY